LGSAGEARVRGHFDMTTGIELLAERFGLPQPRSAAAD
jgi:hypothetical protein